MFARALNTLSALKRKPPQRPGRRRPVVEGMEPRILFSADGLAALMAPMDAGIHTLEHVIEQVIAQVTDAPALVLPHPSAITTDASVHAGAEAPTVDASPHEIVVIDSRVANYQQLIDDIRARNGNSANIEIIVLNQIVNGIEQVTQLLAGQHGISALHIVSHGVDGGVQLGEGLVDTAVLQREATALAQWAKRDPQHAPALAERLRAALTHPDFATQDNAKIPAYDYVYQALDQLLTALPRLGCA